MSTALTNDQITAGAAVLGDNGQPVGRNTAIMVFDAMATASAPVGELADAAAAVRAAANMTATQRSEAEQAARREIYRRGIAEGQSRERVRAMMNSAGHPAPTTTANLLQWALRELLGALPERRDWLNPDAEKVLRVALSADHPAAEAAIAGADLDLRDLARLFASSHETGKPVLLSASACGLLFDAMTTTAPAAPLEERQRAGLMANTERKRDHLEQRGYGVIGYVMQGARGDRCAVAHGAVHWQTGQSGRELMDAWNADAKTLGAQAAMRECPDCDGTGRISGKALCARCDHSGILPAIAAPLEDEAPQAEPLSEAQIDRIARSYFSEQWAVRHAKDAIHDAFAESGAQAADDLREQLARAILADLTPGRTDKLPIEHVTSNAAVMRAAEIVRGKVAPTAQTSAPGTPEAPNKDQTEWSHDLQVTLIEAAKDDAVDEDARQVMAQAACLLAELTGRAAQLDGGQGEGDKP